MIEFFPDILPKYENLALYDKLLGSPFRFKNISNAPVDKNSTNRGAGEDEFWFWVMDLMDDPYYTSHFFNIIQKVTNRKFELVKLHANGQTYGQNGNWHTDQDDGYTFIYYVNSLWDPKWGGSTVLINEEQIVVQPFIPNAGILFKSNLMHLGSEPTRHFNGLRITIAYLLQEKK